MIKISRFFCRKPRKEDSKLIVKLFLLGDTICLFILTRSQFSVVGATNQLEKTTKELSKVQLTPFLSLDTIPSLDQNNELKNAIRSKGIGNSLCKPYFSRHPRSLLIYLAFQAGLLARVTRRSWTAVSFLFAAKKITLPRRSIALTCSKQVERILVTSSVRTLLSCPQSS